MVYIASDHGGYKLKELLLGYFKDFEDLGPEHFIEGDDYPDYVIPLCEKVLTKKATNKGVVICRNGVGVSMLANKYKDIRCGLCFTKKQVEKAREDDNINVLALPADYIDKKTAIEVVIAFLNHPFSEEKRHKRRLKKFADLGEVVQTK